MHVDHKNIQRLRIINYLDPIRIRNIGSYWLKLGLTNFSIARHILLRSEDVPQVKKEHRQLYENAESQTWLISDVAFAAAEALAEKGSNSP